MMEPAKRFSNRVDNYVKYRPGYPKELFECLTSRIGLTPEWRIADIGSGTGISAAEFLRNGNLVYGVEPNAPMREASIEFLGGFEEFYPIDATAAKTGLPDSSVDLVYSAQAFHWFCNPESARELVRIVRPGGFICLVWNEREIVTNPFHMELEEFLKLYAHDYDEIRHDLITKSTIENTFGAAFERLSFSNRQVFDFESLKGRVISSSYMPEEDEPIFEEMVENLRSLFAVHAENGRITVLYQTILYFSKF